MFRVIEIILKEKIILIPLFTILIFVSLMYYYYYVSEHTISVTYQGDFTIVSKCQAVNIFTFAPYVTISINDFEVLTTAVNEGYDTLGSCMISAVKQVQILEKDKKVLINTEDNKIKEIDIIFKPR